ncbi:MAG: hypothetical protein IJF01_07325 [Tidjanibacter sp.]|nr:hypothetical protein [Tidjanibacter sp.]
MMGIWKRKVRNFCENKIERMWQEVNSSQCKRDYVIRVGLLRWRRVGYWFSVLLEIGETKAVFLKSYEMGAKDMLRYTHDWHPVEAGKDGFATTKALDEIGNNLPVLLSRGKNCLSPDFIAISNEVDWADWQGEIAQHPESYSWRPIHL